MIIFNPKGNLYHVVKNGENIGILYNFISGWHFDVICGNSFQLKLEDLQTIIDKVNELNNVKPSATIDIKRYAQAIVDSCNKYRYSNDDHYDCEHCDECLTDGRAQHKPDCIVLDAQRVLKELKQ